MRTNLSLLGVNYTPSEPAVQAPQVLPLNRRVEALKDFYNDRIG